MAQVIFTKLQFAYRGLSPDAALQREERRGVMHVRPFWAHSLTATSSMKLQLHSHHIHCVGMSIEFATSRLYWQAGNNVPMCWVEKPIVC